MNTSELDAPKKNQRCLILEKQRKSTKVVQNHSMAKKPSALLKLFHKKKNVKL